MRGRLKNNCVFKDSPLPVIVERQVKKKSYKLVFDIVFCIPEHSSLSTLQLLLATFATFLDA